MHVEGVVQLSGRVLVALGTCKQHQSFGVPLLGYSRVLCVFARGPDSSWIPHHRHGTPAEGGGEDAHGHHAVCRQWQPRPRDSLVQRLPPCGYRKQQRPHQAAALR